MGQFEGLLIDVGTRDGGALLRSLGCTALHDLSGRSALLVAMPREASDGRAEDLALRAAVGATSSFMIRASTSVDEYVVTEYRDGRRERRVAFHRDQTTQWELEGAPRPWEAALLFALPVDDFVGFLSDDDSYDEAELDAARRAHAARDLALMPRRPPLLGAALWEWLGSHGVDVNAPDARW